MSRAQAPDCSAKPNTLHSSSGVGRHPHCLLCLTAFARCCFPSPCSAVDDDVPEALFNELALTVLQQSTLCPLPLAVQPVHWAHEHVRVCDGGVM